MSLNASFRGSTTLAFTVCVVRPWLRCDIDGERSSAANAVRRLGPLGRPKESLGTLIWHVPVTHWVAAFWHSHRRIVGDAAVFDPPHLGGNKLSPHCSLCRSFRFEPIRSA